MTRKCVVVVIVVVVVDDVVVVVFSHLGISSQVRRKLVCAVEIVKADLPDAQGVCLNDHRTIFL